MKDAVIYVIFAVLSVTVVAFASYSPNDKWSKCALGVILLASLSLPLSGALSSLSEISFDMSSLGGAEYEDGKTNVAGEAYAVGVRTLICERYGIDNELVSVELYNFSFTDMRAEKIYVTLHGTAVLADTRSICEYLTSCLGCECEVNITLE